MLKRLIFLFCLPLLYLISSPTDPQLLFKGPPSEWVKPCDSLEPLKPSQDHLQYLLSDIQKNCEENTTYIHLVMKILDKTGLKQVAQPKIIFNPFYQKIVMHNLRIFRDGQWLDRFENSPHKLLQREEELDDNLYSGDLTLVFFLTDLRVGDILEYSYSYVGKTPYFASHVAEFIELQDVTNWEKRYRSFLTHPQRALSVKYFNTSLAPKIRDLSPNLQEWSWEVSGIPSASDDDEQPAWYEPEARIQISQYPSWKEVVQEFLPFFQISEDLMTNPSPAMVALIERWKGLSRDPIELATLALRFVQNDVRYLGFENEMGAFKPTDPRIVLERRFGDCKDKAFLLQTFLKLLDIRSSILLVHSNKGKKLPELLPTPYAFDHVALRLELDGSFYYVDPTISFQGGSLQNNNFPSYQWGLLISDSTSDLIPLPDAVLKQPNEVNTSIVFTSPTHAIVKTKTTMYGSSADILRIIIQSEGVKTFKEDLLDDAQTNYKGAIIDSAPEIIDDRERNILTIVESYKISSSLKKGKNSFKVFSAAIDILDKDINLQRSTPYVLAFPWWIKEQIYIENAFTQWPQELETSSLGNESVQYNFSIKKEGNIAELHFELKHLKDHIPVELIHDYWNMVQEIETNPLLKLVLNTTDKPNK